jgi:hypothetical protein
VGMAYRGSQGVSLSRRADLGVRAVEGAGVARFAAVSSGGRAREGREEMDPTRGPGRAERDAPRGGGDGLAGGANMAERVKRARLWEGRRRHVGPAGQTQSGDSGRRVRAAKGG